MEVGFYNQDTPFLTTELQSKWLAHVLSGKVLLPTEEEMMSDVENYYHHMEETGVPKSFTHVLPPNEVLHLFSYLSNLIFLTTHHWMKPFLFWWRKSNWVLHPISNIWSSLDNLYGNKAIDFWWKHFHLFLLKYIVLWALGPGAQLGYLYSTCTIHLYYTFVLHLYYTFVLHPCTTHICLLYKGTDVYSFTHRIEYNYSIFLTSIIA